MNRSFAGLLAALLLVGCAIQTKEPPQPGPVASQTDNAKTSPPAPSSIPLTIGEIRNKVPFLIFVPTLVPNGLTPAVRLREEETRALVNIDYRKTDGIQELSVLNGPVGCCLDADQRKKGESVQIRDNITAHYLVNQPKFGGPILWWQEASAYIALSGPNMDKVDLVNIANSMSSTANP